MRTIVAASCVAACVSGEASEIGEALRALLAHTGAKVVCGLNAGLTRTKENALVWARPDETLAALVFRTEMSSHAMPKAPCWTNPGHCAVFEGPVPVPAHACSEDAVRVTPGERAPFRRMLLPEVYRLEEPSEANPFLKKFAKLAETLWLGVRPHESVVALLNGQAAYLAETASGSRRVRIVPHQGKEINIAKLRVRLDSLDMTVLRDAAIALDVQDFDLAGPDGAVTGVDGLEPRAFILGKCLPLVSANDMHNRLDAANREFPVEQVPPESKIRSAFEDMAQRMLGGEVVHGPPIQFATDQDPKIFMLRSGVARTCR